MLKVCQRARLKRVSLPLQSFGNLINTEKCTSEIPRGLCATENDLAFILVSNQATMNNFFP